MATFFEVRIMGDDAAYSRQAAQAAFAVIDRLESKLSRFREESEVSSINRLKLGEVLRVSPEVFECLSLALQFQEVSLGAFDPGLGPRAEGPRGVLLMDAESLLVGVEGGPVGLDLGAIGKGFALDLAAQELRAWEVTRALLNAGGSSLLALDGPSPGSSWEIALGGERRTHSLFIENAALGSSGTAVKGEHILDPRRGCPAGAGRRTWALAPSAAAADALSTAWMTLSLEEIESVCDAHPGWGAAIQHRDDADALWTCSMTPLSYHVTTP